MPDLYFGDGDNPPRIRAVWLEECHGRGESSHPTVIYIVGAIDEHGSHTGTCPACHGQTTTRSDSDAG